MRTACGRAFFPVACVGMAAVLPASAAPAAFRVAIGKASVGGETFAMRNIPTTVQVDALDAEGNLDSAYAGTARIEGVAVRRPDGSEAPAETIGPFREGRAILLDALVRAPEVRVSDGAASGALALKPVDAPGWSSALPPLLAIILCVATKQVFVALFLGVLAGVYFLHARAAYDLWTPFLRTIDGYLTHSVEGHSKILLWTFSLGGLVALMARSGGTSGIVALIAPFAKTPRSGQLATWALGLAIFFDDYANCYIVGPMMRARTDLLRISREKLAYIVDSTAAPVASLMIVSTWVGVEISYINDALKLVGDHRPGVFDGAILFWSTIPFRFYPLFAILLVFLVGWTLRDFGPMLRAERRALRTGKLVGDGSEPMADKDLTEMTERASVAPRWWNAVVPLGILVGISLFCVIYSIRNPDDAFDSETTFLWGTIAACVVSAAMAVGGRLLTVHQAFETWITGAKSMVMACAILILAWAIGQICKDLHTGDYVVSLTKGFLSPRLVPVLTFLIAAVISFATGTSYGTMAILMPIMVPVAWILTAGGGLEPEAVATIRIATVGGVLAGAIFGDHCSPISDTTIMSSMGSACDLMDHTKTQMPYALTCGAVSAASCLLVGFVATPWIGWACLAAGSGALYGCLRGLGGRVNEGGAESPES